MINSFTAIILGLVEGITEFLPISSTGHLILTGHFMGLSGEIIDTFEIFIQAGAILAVVVLYFDRFLGLLDFSECDIRKSSMRGLPGIARIGAAVFPALIAGALFHKAIKAHLFGPLPVAFALIVGAILMLFAEKRWSSGETKELESLSLKQCFCIGLFQCLALWPGMSRSASTIVGGMCMGLSRKKSAEFSFLIAVPTMFAAVGYDMWKSRQLLGDGEIAGFGLGLCVSFITAVLAVRTFVLLLGKSSLKPFAYYRIALALIVLYLLN